MEKVIWYSVQNGGDGSAYPAWMESEKLCELDQRFMSEGWGEPCIGSITIESESEIYFKEEIKTAETVKEELEEELNEDYMIQDKEEGKYPDWFKRLEGHLEAVNELISKKDEGDKQ